MSLSSAGGNATTFRRFVVLTQHDLQVFVSPFRQGWIASSENG